MKTVNPEQLAREARLELARRNFHEFITLIEPSYDMGWAQRVIACKLQKFLEDVEAQRSPRLMIFLPPRHSKSLTVSQLLPMWGLGRDPTLEFVVASYGLSLPAKFSRRVRGTVRDDSTYRELFPDTELHPDNQSVEDWETTLGGGFRPVGRGGGLTGKGAHVLIIDDILKDAEEADSPVIRESALDWYSSTAYTRLYPGAGVIIVMTRWHVEDLAGVELAKMTRAEEAMDKGELMEDLLAPEDVDQWDVLSLPAIATEDEYVSDDYLTLYRGDNPPAGFRRVRRAGEALHKTRYDERALARIRATLQPRHWTALYQQTPLPDEGAFFNLEALSYSLPPDPDSCTVVIAADTAASTDQSADESCIVVMMMNDRRHIWIADMVVGRLTSVEFCDTLIDTYSQYNTAVTVGIEAGPLREAIMPMLEQRMSERSVFLPLADKQEMRPSAAKDVRARPLQGVIEAGRVSVGVKDEQAARTVKWVVKMRKQLQLFPQSSEDDIVDALAWGVRLILARGAPSVVRYRKREPSWKDRLRKMARSHRNFMRA